MYDKLEKYLLGYLPSNYWYDEGVDIAQGIISNFTDDDWELLLERLPKQDIEWKKKLAYCLYDDSNKYELLVLLELLNTDDDELLEISLDSLRDFITKETVDFLFNNPQIVKRIKELYHNSSKPTQIILEDFINKINRFVEDNFISFKQGLLIKMLVAFSNFCEEIIQESKKYLNDLKTLNTEKQKDMQNLELLIKKVEKEL